MVYTPNLELVVREYEHKKNENELPLIRNLSVIVPDRNELPTKAVNTVLFSIAANMFALTEYNIHEKVVDKVYLSDQSGDRIAIENRERLETRVREIKKEFDSAGCGDLFPEVGYFRIGEEMKDRVLRDWRDIPKLSQLISQINEKGEIYGKGLNMFLSSMLIGVGEGDPNSSVLFLDADYRNRSARQILALSLPLSHMGYAAVTGTFRRYHNNNEKIERGGRVNAGTRAIFDMLTEASLMSERVYSLCGDQGSAFDILKNLKYAMNFGIESTWRVQMHSWVNSLNRGSEPLLKNRRSLQVDIKGSDDVPIGEGKSKEEVLENLANMSKQVTEAALATIGYKNLTGRWRDKHRLMKEFRDIQWRNLEDWKSYSEKDFGEILPISGGISEDELREVTQKAVYEVVEDFYEGKAKSETKLRAQFLPSLKNLRRTLGKRKYNSLVRGLNKSLSLVN